MKTLRLQLRFLVPLVLTLVAAAYLALPLMDRLTLRWFSRDLNLRGSLLTNALADSIAEAMQDDKGVKLQSLLNRAAQDERLVAIALCTPDGKLIRRTGGFPEKMSCEQVREAAEKNYPNLQIGGGTVHAGVHPVMDDNGRRADLVILHDLSFVERRSEDTRQYLIVFIAALGVTIAMITVVVAQLSWRGWMSGARALLRGEGFVRPLLPPSPELAPLGCGAALTAARSRRRVPALARPRRGMEP